MTIKRVGRGRLSRSIGLGAALASFGFVVAEAQVPQILERAQLIGPRDASCAAIAITFNVPLDYRSMRVTDGGRTVILQMNRPGFGIGADQSAELIETLPTMSIPAVGTIRISLDNGGPNPVVTLRFPMTVIPQVVQTGDSSIVVTGLASQPEVCAPARPATETPMDAPADDSPDALLADARNAIVQEDYARAAQVLTKLLALPENARSAEAQELLGVVRERNGQLAHARAEYEIYLEKYPDAEGVPRVRQRLAAILTAEAAPRAPLREAEAPAFAELPPTDLPPDAAVAPAEDRLAAVTPDAIRSRRAAPPPPEEPAEPELEPPEFNASVSSYYYRNQGSTLLTEFETDTTTDDSDVFQDTLITSLDIDGSVDRAKTRLSYRLQVDHEYDRIDMSQALRFSRAYVRVEIKDIDTTLTFGRQTRYTDGVFGRFDGVHAAWQMTDRMTLNGVLGFPVDTTRDHPFTNENVLAGASLAFTDVLPNLDATVYGIAERNGSFTERQALGVETHFSTDRLNAFAILDFDTALGQINTFRASGTWIFPDQSSLTASFDHTASPALTLSNALQGQMVTTLEALSDTYSLGEIRDLARDRTTTSSTATLAYSRPLDDTWQVSVDGSVVYTPGNPASGGVAAIPAPGYEYFASAQVVGTGVWSDRDVVSGAIRFADTQSSTLTLVDVYTRLDLGENWRLKPRFKYGHRELASGGTENFRIPSISAIYSVDRKTDIEAEIGRRRSSRGTPTFAEEANEVYATIGVRHDF